MYIPAQIFSLITFHSIYTYQAWNRKAGKWPSYKETRSKFCMSNIILNKKRQDQTLLKGTSFKALD